MPEITKFQAEIAEKGLTEINGYRLDDGTRAVLRNWPLYKPVIAAVNGFCTAGGMEMLGGCDIRVACPEAKFAVMEPKRGLFAGGGTTVRLPRQIPWPQAMEFLLCADLIAADRAYEMGLLNAIVPREELLDTARAYAQRIIANAPLAVQATKQSALQGLYFDEDLTRQLRAAVRELRTAVADGADPEAAAEILDRLGKELRSPFEKESKISGAIFRTEDAKEGPQGVRGEAPARVEGAVTATVGARRRAHAVHHRRRGAHVASRRRRRRGRARAARDVGRGRTRGRGRRGRGPRCSSSSRASRSCTARRASTTIPSPGSPERARRRSRAPALLRASAARRPSSSSTRPRSACSRGDLDLALITSAEALATQRAVQEARRALPVLVPARGEATVPVGVGAGPDRGRARGVPGVVDVRGVRQRPARPARRRRSTTTATRSAPCSSR